MISRIWHWVFQINNAANFQLTIWKKMSSLLYIYLLETKWNYLKKDVQIVKIFMNFSCEKTTMARSTITVFEFSMKHLNGSEQESSSAWQNLGRVLRIFWKYHCFQGNFVCEPTNCPFVFLNVTYMNTFIGVFCAIFVIHDYWRISRLRSITLEPVDFVSGFLRWLVNINYG